MWIVHTVLGLVCWYVVSVVCWCGLFVLFFVAIVGSVVCMDCWYCLLMWIVGTIDCWHAVLVVTVLGVVYLLFFVVVC